MVLIPKYTKSSVQLQNLQHPSSVAVMAVALSFATYIYNSYLKHGSTASDPIVLTTTGLIQGNVAISREGRLYYEFLAIPFGQNPVGDLRFEPPLPVHPWKGIRMTKNFGPACMQLEVMVTARVQGDEDCLFLNVFSPQIQDARHPSTSGGTKSAKRLETLVFLHGGCEFDHFA
ncbi:unnamed protein product [Orchesella dallaii]|uniref:Carboxylesterase type B domain-containing protein n=1 Tax=Orchesella dallaii TaxID=48710 RepID=A0ABP1PR12_9HEXA